MKFVKQVRREQTVPSHEARLVFFSVQDVLGGALDMWLDSVAIDRWKRFDHPGGVFSFMQVAYTLQLRIMTCMTSWGLEECNVPLTRPPC